MLLYEMLTGLPPFYDENTNEMYRKILNEPLHFPSDKRVMPDTARDLLERLLDRNGDRRLGANGAAEIKAHKFFDKIDWRKLLERKYDPVFKPNVVCEASLAIHVLKLTPSRWTNWTQPTSTANSLQKHRQIHTSKVLCSHRQCSNSLQAGRTIGR